MEDVKLTDLQLCKKLGITIQTLHNHLNKNAKYLKQIKCVKIGSSRRWSESSVDEYLNG